MALDTLIKQINLKFNDDSLLAAAFIHRSYLNENKGKNTQSNERLEYLGDAVLELATSKFLYNKFPQKPEGELTSLRSSLVKTETLAQVAKRLELGEHLKMSRGEERSGGRSNTSLLANTVEALIGSIYLDQGMESVEKFTQKFLFPKLDDIIKNNLHHDFKSTLQETIQSQNNPTPIYQTTKEHGPDHDKIFTVQVSVNDQVLAKSTGASKQKAQQKAAQKALEKLEEK